MNKLLSAIAFISGLVTSSPVLALDNKILSPISVTNAVVYVPLGISKTTTAFFTLKNNSKNSITITKVHSVDVKKITLIPNPPVMDSSKKSSESSLAIVNPWTIAAGQTLVMAPNHQYLQLADLKISLTTGDELQLDVSLSDGQKIYVIAKAKSAYDQSHSNYINGN